jgi:hypothetical protein
MKIGQNIDKIKKKTGSLIGKFEYILNHYAISSKNQEHLFYFITTISYLLLVISELGISFSSSQYYYSFLKSFLLFYVSFVLVLRFNPLRHNIKLTNFDRQIAFTAGSFIMISVFLNGVLSNTKKYFERTIKTQIEQQKDQKDQKDQ